MATVIAYVDGFNLYHGLHHAYGRRYLWLDLHHLVQRVRPQDQILAVRYFTAEVKDDPDGLTRQRLPEVVADPAIGQVHKRPGKWRWRSRPRPSLWA